jgi:hypothetical protein
MQSEFPSPSFIWGDLAERFESELTRQKIGNLAIVRFIGSTAGRPRATSTASASKRRSLNYGTAHSSYNSSTGILEVSDGTTTVDLRFVGNYSLDNFKFADDGAGGMA